MTGEARIATVYNANNSLMAYEIFNVLMSCQNLPIYFGQIPDSQNILLERCRWMQVQTIMQVAEKERSLATRPAGCLTGETRIATLQCK